MSTTAPSQVQTVDHLHALTDGTTARVLPTWEFGNVALDPDHTGSGSQDAYAPYFSQLDNLRDAVEIREAYVPAPVDRKNVYVIVHIAALDSSRFGKYLPALQHDGVDIAQPFERVVLGLRSDSALGTSTDLAEVATSVQVTLAEAAEQMRDLVDLPVQDIARMAGIGRRQYYNIMRGKAAAMRSSTDEGRFRLLHHFLSQLYTRLGDKQAVRGAVLMPLEDRGFRSFVDLAAESSEGMFDAYQALDTALSSGKTSRRRRLPPSGTMAADDSRWEEVADHLHGYPAHE